MGYNVTLIIINVLFFCIAVAVIVGIIRLVMTPSPPPPDDTLQGLHFNPDDPVYDAIGGIAGVGWA